MSVNKINNMGFFEGPWKVDDCTRNDGDAIYVFPARGGVSICDVVARDGEGRVSAATQQAAETTAALIAMVPEMVDAILGAARSGDVYRVMAAAHRINGVLPRKVEK